MKKEHTSLGLSTHQRQRLAKIADFIETVPFENFDMGRYLIDGNDASGIYTVSMSIACVSRIDDLLSHPCDAIGCVVGMTVLHRREIGIKAALNLTLGGQQVVDWQGTRMLWTGNNSDLDDYLFGADWKYRDNDPKNTAKRIRYVLANGLPDNRFDQIYGRAPLPYLEEKQDAGHTGTHTRETGPEPTPDNQGEPQVPTA